MANHPDLADRDDLVIVVIDVQERLAAAMAERERVLGRVSQLVRLATLIGAPVLITRQYPRGLGDTEPALVALARGPGASGASREPPR